MRKYFISVLFSSIVLCSQAQNKYLDSLKTVLAKTTKPIERFDLLNKILEDGYINGENNPDSSYCIEVLGIAEQLNNDSLLDKYAWRRQRRQLQNWKVNKSE